MAVVQTALADIHTSGTPACVFGSTTQAGNLLLAIAFDFSSGPLVQTGWTSIATKTDTENDIACAYAYVNTIGAGTSYTPYNLGTFGIVCIYEISGAPTGTPIEVNTLLENAGTTSVLPTATVTATTTGTDLLIAALTVFNGSNSPSVTASTPTGFTSDQAATGVASTNSTNTYSFCHKDNVAAGAQSVNWPLAGGKAATQYWADMALIAVKIAGVTPTEVLTSSLRSAVQPKPRRADGWLAVSPTFAGVYGPIQAWVTPDIVRQVPYHPNKWAWWYGQFPPFVPATGFYVPPLMDWPTPQQHPYSANNWALWAPPLAQHLLPRLPIPPLLDIPRHGVTIDQWSAPHSTLPIPAPAGRLVPPVLDTRTDRRKVDGWFATWVSYPPYGPAGGRYVPPLLDVQRAYRPDPVRHAAELWVYNVPPPTPLPIAEIWAGHATSGMGDFWGIQVESP